MWPFVLVALLVAVVVMLVARDAAARREQKQRREERETADVKPAKRPRRRRPEPSRPRRARAAPSSSEGDDLLAKIGKFAAKPSAETHRAVFDLVVAHPAYAPYGDEFGELAALYERKRYAEVNEKLGEMMPSWLLSPSVHQIACLTAKHLGDKEGAMVEMQIAMACFEGILASGDGSREAPYLVTRVKDEYDVLQHLEKKLATQRLVTSEGRHLDHMQCSDGSEIWFDVSAPHNYMSTLMGGSNEGDDEGDGG